MDHGVAQPNVCGLSLHVSLKPDFNVNHSGKCEMVEGVRIGWAMSG
jgi:hypothetical protein